MSPFLVTAHCFNTHKEILQGFDVTLAAAKADLEKVLEISWFDHNWKRNYANSSVFSYDMIAEVKQNAEDEKEVKAKELGKAEKDKKLQTSITHYSVMAAEAAMKLGENVYLA